jgi:hypothetical protein
MPTEVLPAVIRAHLQRWNYIAQRQAKRTLEHDFGLDREMDAQLFAFALRQVLRSASLAARVTGLPEIAAALKDFNDRIPDAISIRDQLEHFDEYELGIGKLQNTPGQRRLARARSEAGIVVPVTPYRFFTGADGSTVRIHLGEYILDIVAAALAADTLAGTVSELLP